ncbi:MAG: exosortase A [Vicinamibacterales bacterium]
MTVTNDSDIVPAAPATGRAWLTPAVYAGLLLVSAAVLYRDVAVKLVHDWATDGNYSHGFLIIPVSLFLTWERRQALRALPRHPHILGLGIVLASIAVLTLGTLGAELFLTRVSIIGVVIGTIVFLFGWQYLRALAFPVGFLLLMVPLPALIFNQIAFPLQLIASQAGELGLSAMHIPVLREGNVIVLAHTTLEVVEACSGIRSLVSLLTLGIIYGYFVDKRMSVRLAIVASTVPVAIVANGMRIAGTGIAAHYYGPEAAEGFFHEFSGWVVFVVAFAAILGVKQVITYTIGAAARLRMRSATA